MFLTASNLRKSIRRFKSPGRNRNNIIQKAINDTVNLSTSISSSNLKQLDVIHDDIPTTSSSTSSDFNLKIVNSKSAPTSPNLIRKSQNSNNFLTLQRHTWPLTKNDFRMPMLELIEGEKKYIDLLKMLIIHYLGGYMKAEQDGKLPNSLKNKGMAIFGNVEKVYEFHEKYFLNDLVAYTDNPIDVACAFFNNIERMRDVYTQYIVNKDQNLKFVSSPEVVKFFQELKNNNPQVMAYEKETNQTMNLDSVLMAPIQRIFKYKLLLDRLIEKAPCGVNEIKEVAETIEEIANYANDFIKVLSLEDYKIHASGDFIMSGIFTVTEPKRLLIKREKDYQVFLFENNIVLAKREKDEYSTEKYYFKEKIMLSDVFVVVEHIDISNNKFGLRRKNIGNVGSNESTTIFKAENDKIQQRWVKKLRELTMEMQTTNSKKSTTSLDHLSLTPSSSNRNSRASRDSCELSHTTTTTEDGQSLRSQDLPPMTIGMTNNNNKSEQISFRLSQWPNDDGNGS